jgi:hypothetical protein
MTAPGALRDGTPLNYGFGIMRDVLAGRPALTHGGADAGFRAAFDCYPEDDASVIVFSNGQGDVGAIARALADAYLSPAPAAAEPATPDPAALARLAGYYVSGWGPGLTLEAADGKLMVRAGRPPIEAKFLANGDFHLGAPSFCFSPRPGGDLAEIQGVGGVSMTHRRATRVELSAEVLAALAGTYRSDEIDSTYELAATERGLALSCLRFPPLTLTAADAGAFDGPGMRVTMVRDDAGLATGFTIATGRVRGLAFEKIA